MLSHADSSSGGVTPEEDAGRLGVAFSSSALPQWVFDRESLRFLSVNDAAVRTYGYSRAEFLAMSIVDIRPPDEVERAVSMVPSDSSEGVILPDVWRHRWASGDERKVRLSWTDVTFQGRPARLVQVLDVTEQSLRDRRLAEVEHAVAAQERELQRQRGVLDAVLEHIPEGIAIASAPDVTIERVSTFGVRLTQRDLAELTGKPASEHPGRWRLYRADGVTPAAPDELPLTRATVAGEVVIGEELVLERRDGSRITILCNAGPIRDGERITGGVVAWQDISDRKRLEADRAHAVDELRAAVGAKEQALRVVSHELRQPVSVISTTLPLLDGSLPTSAAQRERAAAVVRRQAQHLTRLADDLFEAARLARGAITLQLVTLDLRDVIDEVVAACEPRFREAGTHLEWRRPGEAACVVGDTTRLAQVFSNVLGNAAKFTPPGGRAGVQLAREGGDVVVRVRDTGIGMSREFLPRAFDMFTQADGGSGLGIGLAVVSKLVRLHSGTVTAHSVGAGCGTEVIVRLPLAP